MDNANMIALLEDYVAQLRNVDAASSDPDVKDRRHYCMPVDSVLPAEWADFDNVYQIHSPKIFFNNAIRDVSKTIISRGLPYRSMADHDEVLPSLPPAPRI